MVDPAMGTTLKWHGYERLIPFEKSHACVRNGAENILSLPQGPLKAFRIAYEPVDGSSKP